MIDRADARLFPSTFPITEVAVEAAFPSTLHGNGKQRHRSAVMLGGCRKISYMDCVSSPTHPSLRYDSASTSAMDVSVIQALGQLLAAAARILDGDAFRRLGGPGLYRRVVSVLAAFLTLTIVMRVRQRASIVGRCFLDTVCEARRHLSHPPAGWAAP